MWGAGRVAVKALAAAAIILVSGLCGPLPGTSSAADAKDAKAAEPVVVTARALTADNRKRVVVYKGDVVVKRGDITLHADDVTIRLAPASKDAGGASDIFNKGGGIQTIEAAGRVRILQGDRTATADKAVFDTGGETIVLTGGPRVWEGGNVLTGTRVSYDIKADTFTVEDAKTMIYPEGAEGRAR